jgi:hypothetical protein
LRTIGFLGIELDWRGRMYNCTYTFDCLVKCSFLKFKVGSKVWVEKASVTHHCDVIDKYDFKFITVSKRFKVLYHKLSFVLGADGSSNCKASFEKSTHYPHANISIRA